MTDPAILGVILAGGKGERLGGPKALRLVGGAPLIARVARVMPRPLAVAGDAEAAGLLNAAYLSDPPGAARGPLAGVLAGLRWAHACGAHFLATAPCDAPLLPDDLFSRLKSAVDKAAALVAYAMTPGGAHPLCALWHLDALAMLEAAMRDGAHPSVRALFAEIGGVTAPFEDAAAFLNVNTPDDLALACQYYERARED